MLSALTIAVVFWAGEPTNAQNDLSLQHSETLEWLVISNPSIGSPVGTFPPDFTGDCYWRVLPGDRVLAYSNGAEPLMTLTGMTEIFADTAPSTPSALYDFTIGPALPSVSHPGSLEPAFFQQGLTTEVFVSLGPTGLPDICMLPEVTCSPPGCPDGTTWSFWFDVQFDSGIPVHSDGTSASDLAIAWFVPGGMSIGDPSSPCPGGDYDLQAVLWTSETQADDLGGISAYCGMQAGGGVRQPLAVNQMAGWNLTFAERVLNVVADSGTGFGFERGGHGGGATNGLKLRVGSGLARLSYEVRAAQDVGIPNQVFVATSLTPVPLPGLSVLGANLLVSPDSLFGTTGGASAAAQGSVIDVCLDSDYVCFFDTTDGAADFASPSTASGGSALHFPVPAGAVGTDIYSQGFVLHTTTLHAFSTNRVRTSLKP